MGLPEYNPFRGKLNPKQFSLEVIQQQKTGLPNCVRETSTLSKSGLRRVLPFGSALNNSPVTSPPDD